MEECLDEELLKEVYGDLYDDLVRVWTSRGICEVLREIHWSSDDPELRTKVIEAMQMAKRMARKLAEYHEEKYPGETWDRSFWKDNPFYSKVQVEKRRQQALDEAKTKNNWTDGGKR